MGPPILMARPVETLSRRPRCTKGLSVDSSNCRDPETRDGGVLTSLVDGDAWLRPPSLIELVGMSPPPAPPPSVPHASLASELFASSCCSASWQCAATSCNFILSHP